MKTHESERSVRSLIKPHLLNLSATGACTLDGIIVERDLEQPDSDIDSTPPKSSKHVIVLHSTNPATLAWRIDGKQKEALFSEGEAIINPAGLFVAPPWSAEVELFLLAISPGFVRQVAEEMGQGGNLEVLGGAAQYSGKSKVKEADHDGASTQR